MDDMTLVVILFVVLYAIALIGILNDSDYCLRPRRGVPSLMREEVEFARKQRLLQPIR